ncbi:hypothetical protein [Aquimarina longa]|uniref:hypothetical protein n=1 Tax=Aquimarina longa TaxID=1080221 RepID=UPI0007812758|nr:hypothetical protein [Aquimarina longa]
MKKLTVLLIALVLGSTQISASDNNPYNSEKQLRNQIAVLLKNPEFKLQKEELSADIQFTLNGQGEIVVLSVASEETNVANYIKSRLNYKKINSKVSTIGNKVFKISLKILKPKA